MTVNVIVIIYIIYLIIPRIHIQFLKRQLDFKIRAFLIPFFTLSVYLLSMDWTVYYLWMEENVEQCGPYIVTIRPDQTRYYLLGQHVGGLKHEGLKG